MRRIVHYLFLLFLLFPTFVSRAQTSNATLFGTVTDENGSPVELANVSLKNFPFGTTTNRRGEYLFSVPTGRDLIIVFSMLGFEMVEKPLRMTSGTTLELNVILPLKTEKIDEIVISNQRQTSGNIVRINPRSISSLPDVGGLGSVEGIVRTLPGVNSNNELSNQYSVRGGNFDENLVYVNGIEVYRPTLIRSGQQEGLSFVNSDMVSSIQFSAGGFDACYGDKMSSVLDIKYNHPTKFSADASVSLMGAKIHVENISKDKKFTYNMGARYKSFKLLLWTLEEKGEYDPAFLDYQGYFTYALSDKLEFGFLGTASSNSYRFVPTVKESRAGTYADQQKLTVFYEGQEVDRYYTYTGAFNLNYKPAKNTKLNFALSAFQSNEQETYDIRGKYYFNEVETNSEGQDDSTLFLGIGYYQEHGRNFINAGVLSADHNGSVKNGANTFQWGANFKQEYVTDKMNEWEYRDSAGYSLPFSDTQVRLYYSAKTDTQLVNQRYTAYIQDSYSMAIGPGLLMLTGGARTHYWSYTNKLSFSPRFSASYKPGGENDIIYRLSFGWYHQPAFYRELKDLSGHLNSSIQTPYSFQIVTGADYSFIAWDRPFKLTTEAYYKSLKDLIPYQYENVRIRYLSNQISNGYATGIDFKVNGEFVSGTQSWVSVSLMKTMEDIVGDGKGWIPRPNDQRFKFSMFFQDYLPGLPQYQMNLTGHYITGAPYGMPRSPRWTQDRRMESYKRVDIGFLRLLVTNGDNLTKWKLLDKLHECSVGIEVYNIMDIKNVSSYSFIADFNNQYHSVANHLTGRMFNLKISAAF